MVGTTAFATALAGCSGGDGGDGGGDGGDGGDGDDESFLDEEPDYGEYLDDAKGYDGQTPDRTGEDRVTARTGAGEQGFAFDPATVAVEPGTTVVWEWTGEGGAHNVVANDGAFDSGDPEDGDDITFEHTFDESGVFLYHCTPHEGAGMKGAVYVVE